MAPGSRSDSILTIPFTPDPKMQYTGAVFMWFSPYGSIASSPRILLEIGELKLIYDNISLSVQKGENNSSIQIDPVVGQWYPVLLSWSDNIGRLTAGTSTIYIPNFSFDMNANHICVGFSEELYVDRANALIDDLTIISKYNNNIGEFKSGVVKDPDVYLSFDGNVSKFDSSVISLSIRNANHSPVIVQKEDGTELRRMMFMDPQTGEYIPYAIQSVPCGTSNVFQMLLDDIDNETHKPVAYMSTGQSINVLGVDGDKVTLDIDPKKHIGQTFTIIYYPKNSYTIDYQDNDLCRIMLGKHDGQKLTITYEGSETTAHALLTNIDLNAINNPNHDGFVYLTNSVYQVENLNYSISPKEMKADGNGVATIVVDARDRYGNIVTDIDVTIDTKHGSITVPPAGYTMEVPLTQQAGRYLFQYKVPMIDASVNGYVYDEITIKAWKDQKLQMSAKTSIKLLSV
jgi:hypothetical protein